MKRPSFIIRSLLIISLLLCNALPFFAQKATLQDSVATLRKDTKYGRVRLNTYIQRGSYDALRAILICGKDTLQEDYKSSNFFFWNKVPVGIARVILRADGFIADSDTLYVRAGKTTEKALYLTDRVIELQAVTVKGKSPAMVYRGDTIRFNPLGVSILEDDVARNILEQMPGVKVSDQKVEIGGKEVEKTYVDGKKIFGENPMTALNQLPATDVLHIYAYDEDEHKEQSLKNRKGRRTRVLNIETKSKLLNSKEGNLIASMGGNLEKQNLADHDVRYGAGGTFNFFSEKMMLSINAMHNNLNWATNQTQILLSTKNPPQAYSENSYGGFNLSRRWEKETGFYKEVKGGYHFARTASETNTRSEQDYFATDAFQQRTYISQNHATKQSNKHDMNVGFDMNDKKWGTLGINYMLSTDNARQNSLQQIENNIDGKQSIGTLIQNNRSKAYEMQGRVSWSKFFDDWKYSIGANYTNNSSDEKENRENDTENETAGSLQEIISIPSDGRGNKWQINTELNRSLSKEKNQNLGLSYLFEADNRHINQLAWNKTTEEIDQANTYSYRNQVMEHTSQVTLFLPALGIFYISLNAGWKHSILKDKKETIETGYEKTFNALVGDILLSLGTKLSESFSHVIKYSINSQLPNIVQLRSEIKNSNPYFLSSGNPNLKAATLHKFSWQEQYRINNYGNVINSEVTLSFVKNNISSRTIYFSKETYLPELNYTAIANSSLSSYDNQNGGWSGDWDLFWVCPIVKIKSNLNATIRTSYEQAPYYYDNVRDVSRIKSIAPHLYFSTNLIPRLRSTINWGIRYQRVDNKVNEQTNTVLTNRLGIDLACTPIWKYFFANVSYTYQQQNNKSYDRVDKEHILNVYAGAKLFERRAELSVTAYDLLNSFRNQNILMKDNYISYTNRENFGRYFAISFSWKFRKIKSNRADSSMGVSW